MAGGCTLTAVSWHGQIGTLVSSLSTSLSTCLPAFLPVYQPVYLSTRLSTCLLTCLLSTNLSTCLQDSLKVGQDRTVLSCRGVMAHGMTGPAGILGPTHAVGLQVSGCVSV